MIIGEKETKKMNIKELLDKQRELDAFIAKEKGLGDPYDTKWLESRKLALLVEVAELANATRCFKYWSNKGPESKERILDESADCIHFCLSLMNFKPDISEIEEESIKGYYEQYQELLEDGHKRQPLEKTFNEMFENGVKNDWENVFIGVCLVNFALGHAAEDLEKAFLKKHEVNYKRQVEGY